MNELRSHWRPILVVLVACIVIVVAWRVVMAIRHANVIEASGTLEATESDVSPKVQGRLLALRVQDGDAVKKGQVIAVLERVDPQLDVDQARANVTAAAAQVNVASATYDLQEDEYRTTLAQAGEGVAIAGSRVGQAAENLGIETRTASLDVDQANAQLAASQSAFAHARIDLVRTKSLVSTGDEPQQALDDATDAYNDAASRVQAARDAVAGARANLRTVQVRQYDVKASHEQHRQSVAVLQDAEAERRLVTQRRAQLDAARAQLVQAQSTLGLAQDHVRETDLRAPFDGYVISHNFEVGDLIEPGAAVMTVGDLTHPYAYVYVSETDLPRIKTGTAAQISIDGLPGRRFDGTITEINDNAEFTPENVQTQEERIEYLVFRVKIQFTDRTGLLKPGLPADATIPVVR